MENLDKLVNELRKLPTETQWLEFKHNNYTPDMIGRDISALANSASLYEKSCAYTFSFVSTAQVLRLFHISA